MSHHCPQQNRGRQDQRQTKARSETLTETRVESGVPPVLELRDERGPGEPDESEYEEDESPTE